MCEYHTFDITAAHLSYTTDGDIATGAQFIVEQSGLSGSSSTTTSSASAASSSSSSGLSSIFGL